MEKPKLSVSFSGGRTSAYMSYLIKEHWSESHDLSFIFANTGKENEETLIFVDRCDKEFGLGVIWVEAIFEEPFYKIVDFKTASRNGEPFEEKIGRYGIPNMTFPWCNRELKLRPLRAVQVSIFGYDYDTAIGIRMDEFDRMSDSKGSERLIYPLIKTWPSTKQDVTEFWAKMPFDLGLDSYQGNCDFCWKKSLAKRVRIAKETPEKLDWWEKMEDKYSDFRPETQVKRTLPSYFGRDHKSTKDIRLLANKPSPIQFSMFDDFGMDACGMGESCEAL